jgi:kinesin family protein 3/17
MNKFKAAAQATVNAGKDKSNSECVKVVVRCRPLSQKEVDEGRQRMVEMDLSAGQISLRNPKAGSGEPPKVFSFDLVRPAP